MAWQLGLNVSTITQAYREAARRHLVTGEVGRGTYVLADSREAALFGLKDSDRDKVIDLSTNVPVVDLRNHDLDETLRELSSLGLVAGAQAYSSAALIRRSQIAAASWLAWRGLALRPRDVVTCAGAQQALLTALLALCRPNDSILVEELTFPGMKAVAKQFEAVFVRQMFKASHEAKLADDDLFGSDATDQFREMQDSHLADQFADKGSFGLGDLLVKQFQARVSKTPPAAKAGDAAAAAAPPPAGKATG